MIRTLLAGLGAATLTLAAVASPAAAADLPRPAPIAKAPAYVPPPLYNWTGLYVGLNGGYGWGRSSWDSADSFNVSGGLIGGTLGYNWQAGNIVFGLEGDLDWSDIKGSTTTACPAGCETRNNWLGTVRGRLGYAMDRFMPYVTGGLAVGDISANPTGFAGTSATKAGWTLGGGVEAAIAGNWTAKAEYLYVDLGSTDCGLSCGGGLTTDNVSFKTNLFRVGLNYRF